MSQERTTLAIGTTIRDPFGDRYVILGLLGKGDSGRSTWLEAGMSSNVYLPSRR